MTIAAANVESAADLLRALPVDLAGGEIRADFFTTPPAAGGLESLRAATPRTMIYTSRENDARAALSAATEALYAGLDLVDLDASTVSHSPLSAPLAGQTILSHHDFDSATGAGDAARSLLTRGSGAVKVALTPRNFSEDLQILSELIAQPRPMNLTMFGMGSHGLYSRVVAPCFGSALAFLAPDPATRVAPGQLTYSEAKELYGDLSAEDRTGAVIFGVAGWPVRHSRSPAIHNARFRARGDNALYAWIEVEEIDSLLQAIDSRHAAAPAGVSITAPHKEAAYRHALASGSTVTDRAAESESVNTYVRVGDRMFADNTDVIAFETAAAMLPREATVALLGAGGTARAAAVALRRTRHRVTVYARPSARTAAFVARYSLNVRGLSELAARQPDIILNTLPSDASAAVPLDVVARVRHYVAAAYDGEASRALAEAARSGGASVIDGEKLLLLQSEEQTRLFRMAIDAAAVNRSRG